MDCLKNSREARAYPQPDKLPGEVYDIKEQCRYAFGDKFKPYVTSKSPYEVRSLSSFSHLLFIPKLSSYDIALCCYSNYTVKVLVEQKNSFY